MAKKVKFKDLSDEDKGWIIKVYQSEESWDERLTKIASKYSVTARSIRNWVKKLGITQNTEVLPSQFVEAQKKTLTNKKRFLVTWAQNNTAIDKNLWANMKAYAKWLDADISVIAGRYRNPTTPAEDNTEVWWAGEVLPYLDANRQVIHNTCCILADVKTQPTAAYPLSGFAGFADGKSIIVGHPKMHMMSLPVLEGERLKRSWTTGSITKPNYSDSRAGKLGEFYHTMGFVIVEIDGDETYVRQVPAIKNGSFQDLIFKVKNGTISEDSVEAVVLGDTHHAVMDEEVDRVTQELLNQLSPKKVVFHDLFDGESISHWDRQDRFKMLTKHEEGRTDLLKEMTATLQYLENFKQYTRIVVSSNHSSDWIERWLRSTNWQDDYQNAKVHIAWTNILISGKAPDGVFNYLLKERFGKEVVALGRKDSYKVKGIELSQHGDFGVNGSRGSLRQFAKLSTKSIIGHSHCLPAGFKVQFKDRGWGEIKTVKSGDTILTYNPITGSNEWNKVNNVIEAPYEDIMYTIKGNGFHQIFTKDHHLMLRNGDYIKASDAILSRSASELPLTAQPSSQDGILVPEKIVRQIVAIAADGSKDGYRVRFHFRKQRKIDRIKKLFGSDLIQYNTKNGDFDGYISIKSSSFRDIKKYKSYRHSKRLTRDILKWDTSSLAVLEDELRYWDGTYETGSKGRQFSTTSKGETNVVMSVLNRLGMSCRTYPKRNNETTNIITYCVDRDIQRENKSMRNSRRLNSWGFSSNQTKTKVYCVEVNNKCFWTMSPQTGQVSLTGNSDGRINGTLQVGTMTPARQEYCKGASNNAQSHAIIHKNGKTQNICLRKYKITTLF